MLTLRKLPEMELADLSRHARLKAALPAARRKATRFSSTAPLPKAPKTVMGIEFPNPLGLAAGFDKDGTLSHIPSALGLGFMEIGTLTGTLSLPLPPETIIGLNIGIPHTTPFDQALSGYVQRAKAFGPEADFLIINLSSPFLQGFRRQGGPVWIRDLMYQVKQAVDCPVCLKLRSDDIPDTVHDLNCDAIVVAHMGTGEDIKSLYARLKPLQIISVGQLMTQQDIETRLDYGADLIEIFSLLVTKGPQVVRYMSESLFPWK